jgi:ubiquinone/menaquinone biosynthesis C-methylase UbiE
MANFAEAYYRERLIELVSGNSEWLDLGCGHQLLPGWLKTSEVDQRTLSSRCKRLTGIDASAEAMARHPYLHERVVGDIQHLPFSKNSFTLLTARSVVEHIEQPVPFLCEAYRVLKPGGHFLFATPNYLHYQFLVASLVPEKAKVRLIRYLEGRTDEDVFKAYYRLNIPSQVEKLAVSAGFEINSVDTVECLPEFGRLGHPVVDIEKAITAILRHRRLRAFRAVIVAILRKPSAPPTTFAGNRSTT